jgi:hypothetical protein
MKRIFSILVGGIFILSGFGASVGSVFNINETIELGQKLTSSATIHDELDQSQTIINENMIIPIGHIHIPGNPISVQVAQSFIPTKEILTRVELFIGKNATVTYPLSISIREELIYEDLTALDVDPSVVPTEYGDWVEINFDDIVVTTGLTYYIVAITENVTDNIYGWGGYNLSESYPDGCMWYSIDDGDTWTNESASSNPSSVESFSNQYPRPIFEENKTWDMCFKTYGFDNLPPDAPVISGPTSGKPNIEYDFTFNATDPEEDAVMYIVDWGDDNMEWTEYGDSGVEFTLSHTWSEQGTFWIKAQAIDIHGAESEWGEFTVTIPRDKAINFNFLEWLNVQLPNAFPILRYIYRGTVIRI